MRAIAMALWVPALAAQGCAGACAAWFSIVHRFTHQVMHPAVFGCCPVDHPEKGRR